MNSDLKGDCWRRFFKPIAMENDAINRLNCIFSVTLDISGMIDTRDKF